MEPVDQDAMKLLAARAVSAGATGQNVPSPCISVCTMNFDGSFCLGCWRSIDEIAVWSRCNDGEKRTIWARIANRLATHEASNP
jgi:predicted Fe-S protein YdhL (DUF1289 family)